MSQESSIRAAVRKSKRVVIKAGTSVITNSSGLPSLTRIGSISEQVAALVGEGKEVILVSSGAVGMGRKLLRRQNLMSSSLRSHLNPALESTVENQNYSAACAAAGQFGLMNIFSTMFDQMSLSASQLLLTQDDFKDSKRLANLRQCVSTLLSVGVIPIINENDAVSANLGYTDTDIFSDNDSLAALCARNFGADAVLLLTDVNGVYDRPPNEPNASVLPFYFDYVDGSGIRRTKSNDVLIGMKSKQGRGGMGAKIDAALSAVSSGSPTQFCVVACGHDLSAIPSVFGASPPPKPIGTLFINQDSPHFASALDEHNGKSGEDAGEDAREKAKSARSEARKLLQLPLSERRCVLYAIADALLEPSNAAAVLAANAEDLQDAEMNQVDPHLIKRLKLTKSKLSTLSTGIKQIADSPDPLNKLVSECELATGLNLTQVTVPIGVLMIIFESRPDSLPQIAALSIASCNGLLLKGGREAARSNAALHSVIGAAVESGSGGRVGGDIVSLVTSRSEIKQLLALDDSIDLVIPRGGNKLVQYIKANTKIPVLGHADGVCHAYIDKSADGELAARIVVDAKTDYPAACNAVETVLLHSDTVNSGVALSAIRALRLAGVQCLGGPRAMSEGLCDTPAPELKMEYGDLRCLVEVVSNMDEAVDHIHKYGSGHTETIVTEDGPAAEEFLRRVDSACCFHNASTRFADGFRFGMGAEVGISTGRIHARGPCGVGSLLTTKWVLRSKGGDIVGDFAGDNPKRKYTHIHK